MIDDTWKLFYQTGNIEAYLLLKELEKDPFENDQTETEYEYDGTTTLDKI